MNSIFLISLKTAQRVVLSLLTWQLNSQSSNFGRQLRLSMKMTPPHLKLSLDLSYLEMSHQSLDQKYPVNSKVQESLRALLREGKA